jgi:uridine phosphorylase
LCDDAYLPILDFDPEPQAIINPPENLDGVDMPKHVVICFFREVIEKVINSHQVQVVTQLHSENGAHPVYAIDLQGQKLAFFYPNVGAPLAAGLMDEVIALGAKNFIACGGCGVLDKDIGVGHILVPEAALRDEGTSYHYLPPSAEVTADAAALASIEAVLDAHQIPYLRTKTWSTDGYYRETPGRVQKFREMGCLAVEMEAAAFMAVAQFRGVQFGQLLYGGDVVHSDGWDFRGWNNRIDIREQLFWLAAEACLNME